MVWFKKKVKSILTEEDYKILRELERKSYMEKAQELIKLRGEDNARKDYEVKKKKEEF